MATKEDVNRLHKQHPDWDATKIAAELGCMREYVDKTSRRYDIALPRKRRVARAA